MYSCISTCRLAGLLFPNCVLHCCFVGPTVTKMYVQVSRSDVAQNVLLTGTTNQRKAQQVLRGVVGRKMEAKQKNGK